MARIVVVDDQPIHLKLVRALLAAEGHDIALATSAEEALVAVAAAPTALLLTDLGLPGMGGLELVRRLRGGASNRALRIVAVTARAMGGDEARALGAGCDAYVVKPYDTRALLALVRRFLAA